MNYCYHVKIDIVFTALQSLVPGLTNYTLLKTTLVRKKGWTGQKSTSLKRQTETEAGWLVGAMPVIIYFTVRPELGSPLPTNPVSNKFFLV